MGKCDLQIEEKHLYTSDEKLKWWGHGEWVEEPDEVNFFHNGISCRIVRMFSWDGHNGEHAFGGYLNGYISIPKDHPCFGKHMDYIPVEGNGGITYSEIDDQNHPFLPKEGHWIGFDCSHSYDYCPSVEYLKKTQPSLIAIEEEFQQLKNKLGCENSSIFNKSYKNIAFCIAECKSMADQLLAVRE